MTHQHIQDQGTRDDGYYRHGDKPDERLYYEVVRAPCTVRVFKSVDLEGFLVVGIEGWKHEEGAGN